MRLRPLTLALALAAACREEPSDSPPPATSDDTDVETDTPDDSDPPADDSDTEVPPDPPRAFTVPPGVTAVLGDPFTCLGPSLRTEARFDDKVASEPSSEISYIGGAGVALGDLSGDGRLDVVAVLQSTVRLYLTDPNGRLIPSDLLTRPHTGRDALFGVSMADPDGDGDLDLYITDYPGGNVLLRNDGSARFDDITDAAGVAGPSDHYSTSSAWADMDRDGDLDLLIGGHGFTDEEGSTELELLPPPDPTLLFENNGDGTFTDRTDRLPADVQTGWNFIATPVDLNGDGWLDIYLGNDFAGRLNPSQSLLGGPGLTFTRAGIDTALDVRITAMGLAVGDVNLDGTPDLVLPGWNELGFMVSRFGTWFDEGLTAGLVPDVTREQKVAWGSEFFDADNDGDLDLAVLFGYLDSRFNSNDHDQPDALYLQEAPMQFVDRGVEFDFDQIDDSRGIALGDINRDGWVDVVKNSTNGKVRVMESRCADRSFLVLHLRQPGMNRFAIGAHVRAEAGPLLMTRSLFAGGTGYASSNAPELHFGTNDADWIDRLVVTWPDGVEHVLVDVPTNRTLTLTREP